MKTISIFFAFLFWCASHGRSEEPFPGNLKEVKVVSESRNARGEKLVLREFKVQSVSGTPGNAVDRSYYRFEFWSHNVLFYAETRWKDGDGDMVSMKWVNDSECKITLIPEWAIVTFSRDKDVHWSFARRID